jgi:murein DD-endopeptidase MepM/ murein hydrolase activator NlpD
LLGGRSLPGYPNDPQDPECLERAVFGKPEDSAYVLPYPVGSGYEVFQTYCGPVIHGKDGQISIDFLIAHLQQGSLSVKVGDRVVGDRVIARSGTSGTSLEHLHFGVASRWPVRRTDDLPVNFRNAVGALDARGGLLRGVVYRASPLR